MGGFINEVGGRFGPNEALAFDDPLAGGTTVRWTYADLGPGPAGGRALVGAGDRQGRAGRHPDGQPPGGGRRPVFGAGLAGAVAVPLSTFSSPAELGLPPGPRRHRSAADPDRAARSPTSPMNWVALRPSARRVLPVPAQGGGRRPEDWAGTSWSSWTRFRPAGSIRRRRLTPGPAPFTPRAGLAIYSSGTTDRPKGCSTCHRAATLQFWLEARDLRSPRGTRMWTALPMFWTAGLNTAMGATLAAGGCWVMQEASSRARRYRSDGPRAGDRALHPPPQTPPWRNIRTGSRRTCPHSDACTASPPSPATPVSPVTPAWNMPVAYGLSETCSSFASHYSTRPARSSKASSGRLLPGQPAAGDRPGHGTDAGTRARTASWPFRGPPSWTAT